MDQRPPRPEQPYAWDDERLSAYLDGELSAPEQAQLEARLVVDPELRQLVDELRAVRQQLEILPEYRLQATFAEQVLRRAEQEMLLSPLGREPAESPRIAANVAIPVVPTATVQPAVLPLPIRPGSRRWQRGVIWTAVAAAAVLLLIVTNQPRGPEQDQLARHYLPQGATVETGAAKTNSTKMPATATKSPVVDSATVPEASVPELSGDSAQGFSAAQAGIDKQQNEPNAIAKSSGGGASLKGSAQQTEAQKSLRKQTVPSGDFPISDGAANNNAATNSPAAPPVAAMAPMITPPKPADATSEQNQQARVAGRKGMNAAESDKMMLKNQAAEPSLAMQEKQSTQLLQQLPTELAALLASDDFSQRSASRDEKNYNAQAEEQVLVVYLTPRAEPSGDRSFESLLAKNSIELADKSLTQPVQENRPRTLAAPTPKLERPAAEPLVKKASDMQQDAGDYNRKSADLRDAGKAANPGKGPAMMKEINPTPASDLHAEHDMTEGNELYYLEAEEGQVEELLRQLRAAPDRFSRLSVAARGLPMREDLAIIRDEKRFSSKSSPAVAKAESNPADSNRGADTALAGAEQRGKQQPGEQKQLAQGAAPAPPTGAQSAGALAPPAMPTAEPAAMPFAAPMPAAPAPTTPLPRTPLPGAAPLAASAMPSVAPVAGNANAGQFNESQTKDGLGDDARGNRRTIQTEKSLQQTVGDRVIAYRLRGVESLMQAKNADAIDRGQGAGGGLGGGGTKAGKPKFGKAKASESEKSSVAAKPNPAAAEMKADGIAPGQAPSSRDASPPAPQMADPMAIAPQKLEAPEKKIEQHSPPLAEPASEPDRMPAPNEAMQRLMTRNKESVTAEEQAPAESAKKSTAAVPKRVRVLFVIEHEPPKE